MSKWFGLEWMMVSFPVLFSMGIRGWCPPSLILQGEDADGKVSWPFRWQFSGTRNGGVQDAARPIDVQCSSQSLLARCPATELSVEVKDSTERGRKESGSGQVVRDACHVD